MAPLPSPSEHARHWRLDPSVVFLNHGSFGAAPLAVLEHQAALRAELEAEPVRFLARELEGRMAEVRAALGAFVGCHPDDLALVSNATAGVNTVLRSLRFEPGDELLTTDHEYNASRNALDFAAAQWGAKVVVAKVPFPLARPDQVTEAVLAKVTDRTRLVLVDHVTSQTGLVFPIAELQRALVPSRRRAARRRRARPGDVAAAARAARGRLLHRQLPQVALHPEGRGAALRAARSPAEDPPAQHQPRRELGAHRRLALPRRVRLVRHRRPDARGSASLARSR